MRTVLTLLLASTAAPWVGGVSAGAEDNGFEGAGWHAFLLTLDGGYLSIWLKATFYNGNDSSRAYAQGGGVAVYEEATRGRVLPGVRVGATLNAPGVPPTIGTYYLLLYAAGGVETRQLDIEVHEGARIEALTEGDRTWYISPEEFGEGLAVGVAPKLIGVHVGVSSLVAEFDHTFVGQFGKTLFASGVQLYQVEGPAGDIQCPCYFGPRDGGVVLPAGAYTFRRAEVTPHALQAGYPVLFGADMVIPQLAPTP